MGRKKITQYTFDDELDTKMRVDRILRILECENVIKKLSEILDTAQERKPTYLEFIKLLFDDEMEKREDSRVTRWRKNARFPWEKGFKDYDFNFPKSIEKEKVLELAECRWIEKKGNVVFFGPSGVGKTHLSIALGYEAIQRGHETRFVTIEKLTEMIKVAIGKDEENKNGEQRKKLLHSLSKIRLLILDDLAFGPADAKVGDFLFHLICRRYEYGTSTIMTSNGSFMEWDKFFGGDKVRTMAAIDRILRNCISIHINGGTYRPYEGSTELSILEPTTKKVVSAVS